MLNLRMTSSATARLFRRALGLSDSLRTIAKRWRPVRCHGIQTSARKINMSFRSTRIARASTPGNCIPIAITSLS